MNNIDFDLVLKIIGLFIPIIIAILGGNKYINKQRVKKSYNIKVGKHSKVNINQVNSYNAKQGININEKHKKEGQ